MKKIHYRNIGYPKTGTNWLYRQLMSHPRVDGKILSVFKEFNKENMEDYISLYKNFDVSFNLNTHIFSSPYAETHCAHPKNIHNYTSHITLTFRNLYEVLESVHNMEKNKNPNYKMTMQDYVSFDNPAIKTYCDTKRIFDEWKKCKLFVKHLFYEDLVNDPKQFMFDICSYIGIDTFYNKKIGTVFKTNKIEKLIFQDEKLIKYINDGISIIEDHTNRDLSHWKK